MVALIGVVLVLAAVGLGVFYMVGRLDRPRKEAAPAAVIPPAPVLESGPQGLPPKHPGLLRQVSDADIEFEIRSGRVFNAIRLYREQTGADAQEARSAVEAWRNRLTAS